MEEAIGAAPDYVIAKESAEILKIGEGSDAWDVRFSQTALRDFEHTAGIFLHGLETYERIKDQRVRFWRTKTTDSGRTLLIRQASIRGPFGARVTTHALPEDAGEPVALVESPAGLTLLCQSQLLTISSKTTKATRLPKPSSKASAAPFGLARDPSSGALLLGFRPEPAALDARLTLLVQESPTGAWQPWPTRPLGTLKPGELAMGLVWSGEKAKDAKAGPLLLTTAGIRRLSRETGLGALTAWPPGLGLQEGDRIQAHVRQGRLWLIADRLGLRDGNKRDRSLWVVEPETGKRVFAAQW